MPSSFSFPTRYCTASVARDKLSGVRPSYLFSAPTKNSPGAPDLSRRNAGKADPRLEFQDSLADQIFLRTKVRAPFARSANTLNTYAAVSAAATSAGPGA